MKYEFDGMIYVKIRMFYPCKTWVECFTKSP